MRHVRTMTRKISAHYSVEPVSAQKTSQVADIGAVFAGIGGILLSYNALLTAARNVKNPRIT